MIYLTGDTHGEFSRLSFKNFPEFRNLTKNDYVIVLGDFGLIFNHSSWDNEEKYWLEFLNNRPFTTLFIDGNHECFPRLNEFPIEEWNGGKIHKISNSVFHLMRGQVFNIDGVTFFTMGGAKSQDKAYRKEGKTWWEDEMPNKDELEEGVNNLDKCNWSVNYVLTHSLPTYILKRNNGLEGDGLTSYFEHLENDFGLTFKQWYSGHYHLDEKLDDLHTCLYKDIVKL